MASVSVLHPAAAVGLLVEVLVVPVVAVAAAAGEAVPETHQE